MLWLPVLVLIPLLAAAVVVVAPAKHAKWIAFFGSLAAFVWSVLAAMVFDWTAGGFQLQANVPWLPPLGITFDMGVDAVALLLILLTTFLMPLCVWGSFTAVRDRLKEYYGWLVALEAAMVGVFLARDLIFFYVCFEFTLVPMFFLIALYGGSNRARASIKFFLYTFTGSMITLAGLLYIAWRYAAEFGEWSFAIGALAEFARVGLTFQEQAWLMGALLAGFAVKVPLFPVHTWLPLAHTEAPTAGSVILAGVLLKLGTYGIYRFVLPFFPAAVVEFAPAIAALAVVGILYAALICWVQSDIKRLVAYSSVSHLGFCVLGLFALNPLGEQGAVLYMINHGLSTGALFFLIGMIYERYHTREMDEMSGLARRMPVWAFFMVFFTLASVGLPGLNGFVSEFLCLVGAFTATPDAPLYPGVLGPWYGAIAGVGMILAAMYLLIMLGKVVWGPLREPPGHHAPAPGEPADEKGLPADLSVREVAILVPIALLCLAIGLKPTPLMEAMEDSVEWTLAPYPAAVEALEPVRADAPSSPAPFVPASRLAEDAAQEPAGG